jgi:ectoine hydroxylase-related dioxygenase (phytanoyl-CoA dioxygenase family)
MEIKIGKNLSDIFNTYPELKQWPTVAVPMKAGSASFHSGHLIHGAGANMTPGRRAAMTIQMYVRLQKIYCKYYPISLGCPII